MIVVIIAGGSGTRLWPLSVPDYPKHLLRINNDELSLVQNTYRRAKQLTDKIYVVSEAGHIQHIKKQLNDLPEESFIVEPARRGTANCIIAALVHIAKRHSKDEPVVILSADHYIRDIKGFVHSFQLATKVSEKERKIVLVGVEPDYPATGFGYIKKDGLLLGNQFVYKVDSFKEKPDFRTAQRYVKSGSYLWNCGYFVASVDQFVNDMKHHAKDLYDNYQLLTKVSEQQYESTYLKFENVSIDYGLIEKVDDLLVVPASFDWLDLGSFNDLYKVVEVDETGNHVFGGEVELEEVENAFVQNHTDKPLAVIGLDNIVVVNTPHGTLVVRKDLSQKVGEVSKRFKKGSKS